MTAVLKTFAEWAAAGRAVRKGQHAESYRANPEDPNVGFAVFSQAQTEPLTIEGSEDWPLISVEEWKARKAAAKSHGAPIAKIDYDSTTKLVKIWCGPNQKIIQRLKRAGDWYFNPQTHRWQARRDDLFSMVRAMEDSGDCAAVLTIDGEPYEERQPEV